MLLIYYLLFDGEIWILLQASADHRERLTMSVERLNESSDRIRESRRTILETEDLGVSILQDLHQQRETLLNSHRKVHWYVNAIFSNGVLFMSILDSSGSPLIYLERIMRWSSSPRSSVKINHDSHLLRIRLLAFSVTNTM